jgi:FkbM family methyltransferase
MKQIIKKTPIYPILITVMHRTRAFRLRNSIPYEVVLNDVVTRFRTDDLFSNGWFYPRYSHGRKHEPQATLKFVEKVLNANVVVDVGSNVGWFTCIAACQNRRAEVHSFELDASNCAICRKNIQFNRLTNVTLSNVAVTNYDGDLTYKKTSQEEPSAIHRLGMDAGVSCKVNAVRLDSYFANREPPEVMKIDVEGAEQLVLEGMTGILQNPLLKTILIEIHPKWLVEMGGGVAELCAILENANFVLHTLNHRDDCVREVVIDVREIESLPVGGRMFVAKKK